MKAEGKPIKREWLLRIKRFASKYNENVAERPSLILFNAIAGVEAKTVEMFAKRLVVREIGERRRVKNVFEIPIED